MLKTLLKSVRNYRTPSILAPLTVTGEAALEVLIPYIMARLIDNGIYKEDMSYIIKTGILLACLCIVSLSLGALSGRFAAEASVGFAKNLRHDMYYKVQEFAFSNIERISTAGIITRMTTDTSNVQNAFQMIIRIAVRGPVMIIFSMIMAFRVNSKVAAVFIIFAPVLLIGLMLIIKYAHPIFEKVFKTYDDLNDVVQENLSGIRVVKSYVREDEEENKFKSVSEKIYKYFSGAERLLAFNAPLMQFCVYSCMLLIAWIGARLIVTDRMTTGGLMSLIAYTMQILMSLMMISMVFVMMVISRASGVRIAQILNEKSDVKNPQNPVMEVKDGSIEFRDVCFKYSADADINCLDHIDLSIKSGETIGIIGGTGSSKSSLIHLIPRLYDVTSGEITVGGVNVKNYDLKTLRNAVSVVLQKNVLFSGTVKENLKWGKQDATDEEMEKACKIAQADGFINSFEDGYNTYIEQGGTNVSGGQKQRLCIARALLKSPKILILDDSTSAVDTATDAKIRNALKGELPGTTKIIIAQRISSVSDADRILVIDNGIIESFGTHKELLTISPIYREVFESQVRGGKSLE